VGPLARLKSDYVYIRGLHKISMSTKDVGPNQDALVPDDLECAVDRFPDNLAFWYEGQKTTYAAFEARANTFAHWALSVGLQPGDCVALFMENRPDFVAFWFGMAKVGVTTALINSHLTGKGLAHCISIADAKVFVMSSEQSSLLETARPYLPDALQTWSLGAPVPGATDLGAAVSSCSQTRPDRSARAGLRGRDVALYVYTSGTTGLPKAARMTHARCLEMMRSFVGPCRMTPADRVYIVLPLYHGTSGICGVGAAFSTGAAVVLRKKFSASEFWREAKKSGATMFVYVGELGRYLMSRPAGPEERDHAIIKGFGNGMRAGVWAEFVERTGIERLVEFYGSTEGNVSFVNLDHKVGAIGRIPPVLKSRIQTRLVKVNLQTEEPLRGEGGYCIEAGIDEPGEALGRIINSESRTRFEGYKDGEQTQRKILTNVFEPGDAYFRSGDLLRRDRDGYFYFVDRMGDTFRWKSENVSASEVSEVVNACPGVTTANVYGVEVRGADGRAGMAALTVTDAFQVAELFDHVERNLPGYARPCFLRILEEQDTTGTLKFKGRFENKDLALFPNQFVNVRLLADKIGRAHV